MQRADGEASTFEALQHTGWSRAARASSLLSWLSKGVALFAFNHFDERRLARQIVEPLIDAGTQLFARQQPVLARRKLQAHGRRRRHSFQSLFNQAYVCGGES